MAYVRWLWCSVLTPNWYVTGAIGLIAAVPCGSPVPRSVDRPGLASFFVQVLTQIVFSDLGCTLLSFMGWGLVYAIASDSIPSARWSVRLVGGVIFRWDGRNGLVVEFGQQFTLGIAIGLAVIAMFLFGV